MTTGARGRLPAAHAVLWRPRPGAGPHPHGAWILAAILVAGCVIAPVAVARSAAHGQRPTDAAHADVYVPPSPDTATREGLRWLEAHGGTDSPDYLDRRMRARITIPSLPDVVAQYTGMPSARDRAQRRRMMTAASLPPARGGASVWSAIVLALTSALAGASAVTLARHVRLAGRTRRARRGSA